MAAKKNSTKPTSTKPGAGRKGKKEAPPPVPEVNHGNRGTPTAAPVEVNTGKATAQLAKKHEASVNTAPAAGTATRATVHGCSVTSVLRQLAHTAYPAFTPAHAAKLVAALGIPLRPACLNAQTSSGRHGAKHGLPPEGFRYGPPAKLPAAVVKELLKLAGL